MSGQNQDLTPFQSALNDPIPKPPAPSELDWQIAAAAGQYSNNDAFGMPSPMHLMHSERDGQNAAGAHSLSRDRFGIPIPRPPTPTELDCQIEAARRNRNHVAFDVPPPPPPPPPREDRDTNHGAMTQRTDPSDPS